jgi:hypothetical protein
VADSLDAYFADVRAVEDEEYSHFLEAGSMIGASFWDGNPDKLKEIDRRRGVRPDDPRVYSIAAYLDERKHLEEAWAGLRREKNWIPPQELPEFRESRQELPWFREYWEAQRRHNVRLSDCKARHFPGLSRGAIDTIPNLWAHVRYHLMVVHEQVHRMQPEAGGRATTCDADVMEAYRLLHRLQIPWAPSPPYPAFTQREAMDELTRIANRLERDDAARCERLTAGRASSNDTAPDLSPLQYEILQALLQLKATDAARRQTQEELAYKVGSDATSAASCKAPISNLRSRGLVNTKPSRGGGCWLTAKGKALAESIEKR